MSPFKTQNSVKPTKPIHRRKSPMRVTWSTAWSNCASLFEGGSSVVIPLSDDKCLNMTISISKMPLHESIIDLMEWSVQHECILNHKRKNHSWKKHPDYLLSLGERPCHLSVVDLTYQEHCWRRLVLWCLTSQCRRSKKPLLPSLTRVSMMSPLVIDSSTCQCYHQWHCLMKLSLTLLSPLTRPSKAILASDWQSSHQWRRPLKLSLMLLLPAARWSNRHYCLTAKLSLLPTGQTLLGVEALWNDHHWCRCYRPTDHRHCCPQNYHQCCRRTKLPCLPPPTDADVDQWSRNSHRCRGPLKLSLTSLLTKKLSSMFS